tara:strand:- start:1007 stop:2002 length:996 start_codon:yes stop_codon:yes gene_type:complete
MITNRSRVLITGGQGFLGKAVERALREKGYEHVFTAGGLRQGLDLGEKANIGWLFDSTKPDAVIHLAAKHGGIRANAKYPGGLMYENLNMGLMVVEEARQYNCKKIVNVCDVCAYPSNCPVPFKEEDFWNGQPHPVKSHYAIAKKAIVTLLDGYKKQFGIDSTTLILADLYGPEDNFDPHTNKMIPSFLTKVRYCVGRGLSPLEVWGDSSSTRDLLFVDDAADAITLALEKPTAPSIINVGSDTEISTKDLLDKVCLMLDYKGSIEWKLEAAYGQKRRSLDTSRAKTVLGFTPSVSLEDGLDVTARWFYETQPAPQMYSSNDLPPSMSALR